MRRQLLDLFEVKSDSEQSLCEDDGPSEARLSVRSLQNISFETVLPTLTVGFFVL